MDDKGLLAVIYFGCGALFVGLAVPLLRRRIAPNGWYGFRVPRTLDNADRWYAVNAYAARYLLWGGIATCLLSLLALLPGMPVGLYVGVMTAALMSGPLLGLVLGLRYLGKLP